MAQLSRKSSTWTKVCEAGEDVLVAGPSRCDNKRVNQYFGWATDILITFSRKSNSMVPFLADKKKQPKQPTWHVFGFIFVLSGFSAQNQASKRPPKLKRRN
ncbi:unnamed protein product [Cuscuta epithymum]|uniref:Uncharacterized protein n=1 Tax=Cuscuta epithymum TaxID=186058 RepID=A0AAV0DE63_9ASTE|nr:unnamed protein product [Cuscuta epithymum]